MFKSAEILMPLYDCLSRQSVLAADAPRVASFLGKKITPALAQEIGSRLSTRIEGRCIKHSMGAASVKVYDKFSRVLRIETTVNDVSFFKHHRKVEHRDGHSTRELAGLKKSIYSLIDLREILLGCNQRYVAFLGSLHDTSAGQRDLQRLSQPRVTVSAEQTVKGLNFFNPAEHRPLQTLQHGEFSIYGWRCAACGLGAIPPACTFARFGIEKKMWRIPIATTSRVWASAPSQRLAQLLASASSQPWLPPIEFFSQNAKT